MKGPLSLKIGTSGVRGVAGTTLTPRLVTSFCSAFGTYCGSGRIILGTDTRPSREMVTHAALAGLLSVGSTPVDIGIVPVPTLQHHVRHTEARGGICITASHNPEEWNALKFFGADGILLRPNQIAELVDLYHQGVYPRVATHDIATIESDDTASAAHHATVLRHVDVAAIRERDFQVVIDCCNGAASRSAPAFLRALGCRVVPLHTEEDESFPRDPEPLAKNLGALSARVNAAGADVGFAVDADADRLALVDERGRALGENATLALVVRHMLARRSGPIVVSCSTSSVIDDVAAQFDQPVHRTRDGEIHVLEAMLERGAPIGGEGSGGVIVPAANPCRDSFVAMALTLELLAHASTTLGELANTLPRYARVQENLACRPSESTRVLRLIRRRYQNHQLDLTDGVKVIWPDGWLLVRGSNTEPLVRIVAESRREDRARALVQDVLDYLRPPGR